MNDNPYVDKLAKISGIEWNRLMYDTFLPERGLEDVKNEDIYKVMKQTNMTWDDIKDLTHAEFQRLKERNSQS